MWLGSAIWFGSRSAYAINGLLMLICIKMYVMSCFWIKACRKMTKYLTNTLHISKKSAWLSVHLGTRLVSSVPITLLVMTGKKY